MEAGYLPRPVLILFLEATLSLSLVIQGRRVNVIRRRQRVSVAVSIRRRLSRARSRLQRLLEQGWDCLPEQVRDRHGEQSQGKVPKESRCQLTERIGGSTILDMPLVICGGKEGGGGADEKDGSEGRDEKDGAGALSQGYSFRKPV